MLAVFLGLLYVENSLLLCVGHADRSANGYVHG